MLEELHPAEALPIRIFYSPLNDIFITKVKSVLQVVKGNLQASTDSRTAVVRTIRRAEQLIQVISVDHVG